MSRVVELLCSRRIPHVAALALISFGLAGCSADMSTRFSQNSFPNPFASQAEATDSVPAPVVERRDLPQYSRPPAQYQSQALPPPISTPQSRQIANSGVSAGGGRGPGWYAAPARHTTDRKSTRLNSSHVKISYAVFCLKKKNNDKKNAINRQRPR